MMATSGPLRGHCSGIQCVTKSGNSVTVTSYSAAWDTGQLRFPFVRKRSDSNWQTDEDQNLICWVIL